jgi:4-amino-4-deoxychorismate lyase
VSREQFPNGLSTIEISATNRGLAYGDGVFETMRCVDHEIPLWAHHKERLLQALKRLQIKLDEPLLESELNGVIAKLPAQGAAVIKLIVARGDSERGYRADPDAESWRLWQILPAPPLYSGLLTLGLCETRLANQPLLAGMKHLNRLEQVLARLEWQDQYQDALMCDYHSNVIESVSANVFVLKNNRLFTPRMDRCGVAGVLRAFLINRILPQLDLPVSETEISLEDIRNADGLWLCNSVRGVGEVGQWLDVSWRPSPRFVAMRRALHSGLHPEWGK